MEASARTVVSPLSFSKRAMLHFLCGAVAAQRLAVAMEHEKTYLRSPTSGKVSHSNHSSSAVPSKCKHHESRLRDFCQ
jgi:acetylglutamate kinase